jgi:O-antigen/teichoic acid export membrane protein
MGMIGYLYIPALFRGEKMNYRNILFQNLFAGVAFWVALILFINYFFIAVYGSEYVDSKELASNLSFLVIFIPIKVFLMNFFLTGKKNWTIISIVTMANFFSLVLLYITSHQGFTASATIYMYSLELMTIIPLLFIYIRKTRIALIRKKSQS